MNIATKHTCFIYINIILNNYVFWHFTLNSQPNILISRFNVRQSLQLGGVEQSLNAPFLMQLELHFCTYYKEQEQ